jgi:hypothetical protein
MKPDLVLAAMFLVSLALWPLGMVLLAVLSLPVAAAAGAARWLRGAFSD